MPFPPTSRRGSALAVALGVAALSWNSGAIAQVSAEKSAAMLKPADGLEATLWASEPMVVNPTNMDVDSRGRVWITEGLNYRLTHRPLKKIDEADRIKILEDTDGDGKADKVTVFADHIFPIPMGLAVEERTARTANTRGLRVYVGNSPDILVFEDTDGDDKADKRSVLLTGFGGVDSDHGVHGMTLGPRRQALLHPRRRLLLVRGEGRLARRPELRRRRRLGAPRQLVEPGQHPPGESRRDRVRDPGRPPAEQLRDQPERLRQRLHLRQRRRRQPGLPGDLGHGRRLPTATGPPGAPATGAKKSRATSPSSSGPATAAPAGSWSTKARSCPAEAYKGCLFEADAGTRQINFFPIERHGSSFRTDYKVLLGSDDPWFRPVDMTAAPDGSVFVADWYDAGVGGHSFRDQDTGRIYRVAPKGSKPSVAKPDFATIPGLIALLKSPVVATQDAARRSPDRARAEAKAAAGRTLRQRATRSSAAGPCGPPRDRGRLRRRRRAEGRRPADPRAGRPDPRPRPQPGRHRRRSPSPRPGSRSAPSPTSKTSCRWPTTPTPASAAS